jgi:glucokinase
MKNAYYVGIDIGATSVKTGIVGSDGRLVAKSAIDTAIIESPSHFISLAEKSLEDLLADVTIDRKLVGGIGVGAPGWVDHEKGIIRELTNIPDWVNVPIAAHLEQKTGWKTFVDNDANAMAFAELLYGAGRGHMNFICLTLGTGVGGAIILNGELYRGAHGLAGEIGHMTLDKEGPVCACGANGCLENYVGNRFIVANAVKRLENNPPDAGNSVLLELIENDSSKITPKILADAANRGDGIACAVWREIGDYLGTALAVLVNVLNPECFVIGGGVAKAGPILLDRVRDTLAALAMNELGKETAILEARLSEDAGVIGAATVARDCVEKNC